MRDRGLAQDVLQEAMTRIWRNAHLFDRAKGNALAWMTDVNRNCAELQGYEESLVLEGDLLIGDLKLGPGDYQVAMLGTSHPLTRTVSGSLCFQTIPL